MSALTYYFSRTASSTKPAEPAYSTKPAELAAPNSGTSRTKMVENKTQTHNPNQKRIQPIAITKDNDKGKETVLLPEDNI